MSRITEATKIKEKRGTGEGAYYKPWILSREVGSDGTESVFCDWKHGRQIQCLSQAEAKVYRYLRWKDAVIDIREQFPLDLKLTLAIARRLNLPHPHNQKTHMTTDLVATYENPDGTRYLTAYSVKPNQKSFDAYAVKNLMIEKAYWNLRGIKHEVIYADDLNKIFDTNIKECVRYYDPHAVQGKTNLIKHLIARKLITVDMYQPIDFLSLIDQYLPTTELYNYCENEKEQNNDKQIL